MSHLLILYDISDPKRLQKVAKILENYAVRVQKSVFEAKMTQKRLLVLKREILSVIDSSVDSVAYFNLCEECWQKQLKIGVGKNIVFDEASFKIL